MCSGDSTKDLGRVRNYKYKDFNINIGKKQRYPLHKNLIYYEGYAHRDFKLRIKFKYKQGGSGSYPVSGMFHYTHKLQPEVLKRLKEYIRQYTIYYDYHINLFKALSKTVKNKSLKIQTVDSGDIVAIEFESD